MKRILLGPPPPALSIAVSRSMRSNRAKDTAPELAVRKLIRRLSRERPRFNYRLAPGSPDITFVRARVAIFINGCFWHRCPACNLKLPKSNTRFWKTKFQLNILRDRRKKRLLRKAGWKVYDFWECFLRDKRLRRRESLLLAIAEELRTKDRAKQADNRES